MVYRIEITPLAKNELKRLRAFDRSAVLYGIQNHLTHEPSTTSKSRIRKMVQPAISEYRLRIGDFRVYYNIDEVNGWVTVVHVLDKGSATTPEPG